MRIGCAVNAISANRNDQYATCRGEGRAIINCGVGFGLLGHEVDIAGSTFKDGLKVSDNVTLKNDFDGEYDVMFTYNFSPTYTNYKKLLYFVEPSNTPKFITGLKSKFPDACFIVAARKALPLLDSLNTQVGLKLRHMPVLFPIPHYPKLTKNDFQDFTFDKTKKDIKVFVYGSGWPNYFLDCDDKILSILVMLRDKFGYNITLTTLRGVNNPVTKDLNLIASEFANNITVLDNNSLSYLDILDMISEQDICITKGGWCYCGMCSFDILSLGKLMFYVTIGEIEQNQNINDMFSLNDWVIRETDSNGTVNAKIEKIMADPKACYDAFKGAIDVQRFPEWSKLTTGILSSIESELN